MSLLRAMGRKKDPTKHLDNGPDTGIPADTKVKDATVTLPDGHPYNLQGHSLMTGVVIQPLETDGKTELAAFCSNFQGRRGHTAVRVTLAPERHHVRGRNWAQLDRHQRAQYRWRKTQTLSKQWDSTGDYLPEIMKRVTVNVLSIYCFTSIP